jgi:hypothetical protein
MLLLAFSGAMQRTSPRPYPDVWEQRRKDVTRYFAYDGIVAFVIPILPGYQTSWTASIRVKHCSSFGHSSYLTILATSWLEKLPSKYLFHVTRCWYDYNRYVQPDEGRSPRSNIASYHKQVYQSIFSLRSRISI